MPREHHSGFCCTQPGRPLVSPYREPNVVETVDAYRTAERSSIQSTRCPYWMYQGYLSKACWKTAQKLDIALNEASVSLRWASCVSQARSHPSPAAAPTATSKRAHGEAGARQPWAWHWRVRATPLGGAVRAVPCWAQSWRTMRSAAEKRRLRRLNRIPGRSKAAYQRAGRKKPASLKISLKPAVRLLISVFLPFSPTNELTTLPRGQQHRQWSSGGFEEIFTWIKTPRRAAASSRDEIRHARSCRAGARPVGCRRAAAPPLPALRRRPTTPRAPLPRWCCRRPPVRAGCSSPSLSCGLRRPPPARTAGSRGAGGGGARAAARCVGQGGRGGKGWAGLWALRAPCRSCRRGTGPAVLCPASARSFVDGRWKSVCASGGRLPRFFVTSGVLLGSVFWAFGTRLRRAARAAPRGLAAVWAHRVWEPWARCLAELRVLRSGGGVRGRQALCCTALHWPSGPAWPCQAERYRWGLAAGACFWKRNLALEGLGLLAACCGRGKQNFHAAELQRLSELCVG